MVRTRVQLSADKASIQNSPQMMHNVVQGLTPDVAPLLGFTSSHNASMRDSQPTCAVIRLVYEIHRSVTDRHQIGFSGRHFATAQFTGQLHCAVAVFTAAMDWVAVIGGFIIGYLIYSIYKAWRESRQPPPPPAKWMVGDITAESLAYHNGYDWSKPTLTAVEGTVYDVSRSGDLYGPGALLRHLLS